MTIKSEVIDDILIFSVEIKRATVDTADLLKEKLTRIIKEGRTKVIIDMSQIEFTDSSFLSSLLAGLKQVSKFNGDIKLAGLRPAVRYVFQITRLDEVIEIYENTDSAIKSFAGT
jgi:anti-sigma B factor antagonist